jgi:hypothetical protein
METKQMKITKTKLKKIIKEAMDDGYFSSIIELEQGPPTEAPESAEDKLVTRMLQKVQRQMKSEVQMVDDVGEVVTLIAGIIDLLVAHNPDLTTAELAKVGVTLRTDVGPAVQKMKNDSNTRKRAAGEQR